MNRKSRKARKQNPGTLFKGITKGAKWSAGIGFGLFILGTLAVAIYVAAGPGGNPLVTVMLPALWLIIVISRVLVTTNESDFAAFMDLMKWQIGIAAAAAAVVAPIGLDPNGTMRPEFEGPVILFMTSSILAAIGYALASEAWSQHQDRIKQEERTELAQNIRRELATAILSTRQVIEPPAAPLTSPKSQEEQ